MTRNGIVGASRAALLVALLTLSACSHSDEDSPAGLNISSHLKALPEVDAPIGGADALAPNSRIVGYSIIDRQIIIVGVGDNGCSVAAKAGDGDADSMYLDLTSAKPGAIKDSTTIGSFIEAGMQVRGDTGGELIFRCGVNGIEVCSDSISPKSELEGLTLSDQKNCALIK